MITFRIALLALTLTTAATPFAHAQEPIALPGRESFHLFLLAGQSNMAGRGKVMPEDREAHPRVLALNAEGAWVPAVDPIHFDKKVAGVGLGRSFGIALAEAHPDITIGLIPAAHGGSPIAAWHPGEYYAPTKGHPYDDAVARAKRAMEDGVLRGVLWHQGESDSSRPQAAAVYEAELRELIARFRKEFQVPQLPVLIGQLSEVWRSKSAEAKQQVDNAHQAVAKSDPHATLVSSAGLTLMADGVHFDAKSLREFGRRYAAAYGEMASE